MESLIVALQKRAIAFVIELPPMRATETGMSAFRGEAGMEQGGAEVSPCDPKAPSSVVGLRTVLLCAFR